MGRFLVDIAVLVVLAGFGWAGYRLGLVRSLVRLATIAASVAIALLMRAPLTSLMVDETRLSPDNASLIALVIVGVGAFVAVSAVVAYYVSWVPAELLSAADQTLGAVPGLITGFGWVLAMLALLVLVPADNSLVRSAVRSFSGQAVVARAGGIVQWADRTFPSYTQTLPKSRTGARLRSAAELPLNPDLTAREQPDAAGNLLANLNQFRRDHDRTELIWNLELATAATSHTTRMVGERRLTYRSDGASLEKAFRGALGGSEDLYSAFGEQIGWAHTEANLYAALIDDKRARRLLLDPRYSEIGIGVIDAGWFNGRFYTIGLIGRAPQLREQPAG